MPSEGYDHQSGHWLNANLPSVLWGSFTYERTENLPHTLRESIIKVLTVKPKSPDSWVLCESMIGSNWKWKWRGKSRGGKHWCFPEDSDPQGSSLGYITVFPPFPWQGKENTHAHSHTHKRQPKAIKTKEITESQRLQLQLPQQNNTESECPSESA